MSPAEYNKAADYLGVTADAFVQTYITLAAVPAAKASVAGTFRLNTVTATKVAIAATARGTMDLYQRPASRNLWTLMRQLFTSLGPACIFFGIAPVTVRYIIASSAVSDLSLFWPTVTASVQGWNANAAVWRLLLVGSVSDE
jgi:hypothetical protein